MLILVAVEIFSKERLHRGCSRWQFKHDFMMFILMAIRLLRLVKVQKYLVKYVILTILFVM